MLIVRAVFASVYKDSTRVSACSNARATRIVGLQMGMRVIATIPVFLMVQAVIQVAMDRPGVDNLRLVVPVHRQMTVRMLAHNVSPAETSREILSVAIVIYRIAQKRQTVPQIRRVSLSKMTILHVCQIVRRVLIVDPATSAFPKEPVCPAVPQIVVLTD